MQASKLKGAAVHQQQYRTTEQINDETKLQLPALSTSSVTMMEQSTKSKFKHKTENHKATFHTSAPLHNTTSLTQAADTPPWSSTRERTQLARMENKTHKE